MILERRLLVMRKALLQLIFSAIVLVPSASLAIERQITVFVFIPSSLAIIWRSATVSTNDLATVELGSCSYARLTLPPGVHKFAVKRDPDFFGEYFPGSIDIRVPMVGTGPYYLGYYPQPLSPQEIADRFIDYRTLDQSQRGFISSKSTTFLGVVYPEVATKEIYKCNEVKALNP
jgi:hypothetical protein